MATLAETLDTMTIPASAELVEVHDDKSIRCFACGHRCLIKPGRRGICQVRYNDDGVLRVPWGYVAAVQCDPIEKKPFSHLLPGTEALTYGMLGCDFHCGYCQNWITSQALRDKQLKIDSYPVQKVTPEQMVQAARRNGAQVMASSYNEPLITSEWSAGIFEAAKKEGLTCVYISNGNATPEALRFLRPYLTGYKIDLKTMQDKHYRELGGVLNHVLDSIKLAHDLELWLEVVTLVIPGFNDSTEELWDAARYIASISKDIPWHVTAFHPDYKMTANGATPRETLQRAAEIGQEAGLHFVYAGNLPGKVGSLEDTFCPNCSTRLIMRRGFTVLDYQITAEGTCPKCQTKIPGVWTDKPETVRTGGFGFPKPTRV
jgi:pyruvate formate lyase activating enzyme